MIAKQRLVWLDVLCAAGTLWCAGLVLLLLAGHRLVPTGAAVGVAAVLVLPGFIAGLTTNRVTFRGMRPRTLGIATVWAPPRLPWPAAVAAAVLVAGFLAVAFTGLIRYDGTVRPGGPASAAGAVQTGAEQEIGLGIYGALGVGGTMLAAASAAGRRPRVPLQ